MGSQQPLSRPMRDQPGPNLTCLRAVQITRFGGPEVLELVDVPEPEAKPGQQLYDVSTAGVNYADTHTACRPTELTQARIRNTRVTPPQMRRH
jgi:hypothetical protein